MITHIGLQCNFENYLNRTYIITVKVEKHTYEAEKLLLVK